MATDIMATSTAKLTLFHSILLTRFTRFALASLVSLLLHSFRACFIKNAPRFILLGAAVLRSRLLSGGGVVFPLEQVSERSERALGQKSAKLRAKVLYMATSTTELT